jgi:hypothetical protein
MFLHTCSDHKVKLMKEHWPQVPREATLEAFKCRPRDHCPGWEGEKASIGVEAGSHVYSPFTSCNPFLDVYPKHTNKQKAFQLSGTNGEQSHLLKTSSHPGSFLTPTIWQEKVPQRETQRAFFSPLPFLFYRCVFRDLCKKKNLTLQLRAWTLLRYSGKGKTGTAIYWVKVLEICFTPT